MSNLKYRISAKHLKLTVRQPISRNIIGKNIFQIIIQIKKGHGAIYYGGAGCGTTYKLCEMASSATNPIILSFTNKAIENVKKVFKDHYKGMDMEFECYTFDRYFCDYYGRDVTNLKDKTIFIEEYSMTPNKWMTKMYHAFIKFGSTIYMFRDTNQCDPVEKPSKIHYDYFKSASIKQMCPRRIEMKYIEGEKSRYDIPTKNMLNELLNTGTISHKFPSKKPSYHNICYLNENRKRVTEARNRFTKDKDYHEIKSKYQGKKEQYMVAAGMQFLATANLAERHIFNMTEFKLIKIDLDAEGNLLFMFGDKVFEHSVFAESFIPAFSVTVYKYQGGTSNKPYNILTRRKWIKNNYIQASPEQLIWSTSYLVTRSSNINMTIPHS